MDLAPGLARGKKVARFCIQAGPWVLPWLLLIWQLQTFWTLSPQYQYGWVVIPLGLYLLWRRLGDLREKSSARGGAGAIAVSCAALILPAWWIRAATPEWCVVSYGLAGLVVVFTVALFASRTSWSAAWRIVCPLGLIFAAIPWPQRAEAFVIESLTRLVASGTAEVMQWMGVAAERRGNLIALTTGTLGVSEACSGLRSLQSMLLAALALGELYRLRIGWRFGLVVAGATLALALNLLRNITLALVAYSRGITTAEQWHDPAGWAILILSLPPLFVLAWRHRGTDEPDGRGMHLSRLRPLPMAGAIFLSIWFVAIAAGVELWYRAHEVHPVAFRPLEIRWPKEKAHFRINPIPDRTRDLLLCSEARSVSWEEDDRTRWALASVEWAPGQTSPQFARVHLSEVCLQAAGMELVRKMPTERFDLTDGSLLFEPLEFRIGQEPVYVFVSIYENANRDESYVFRETPRSRIRRALLGQRNSGQQKIEIRVVGFPSYDAAEKAVASRVAALIQ